jgi:hypothetical protein
MKDLILILKKRFYNEIKSGEKKWDYRIATPEWKSRLEGKEGEEKAFNGILCKMGYPKKGDTEKELRRHWKGFVKMDIEDERFPKTLIGPLREMFKGRIKEGKKIEVYAIRVND